MLSRATSCRESVASSLRDVASGPGSYRGEYVSLNNLSRDNKIDKLSERCYFSTGEMKYRVTIIFILDRGNFAHDR